MRFPQFALFVLTSLALATSARADSLSASVSFAGGVDFVATSFQLDVFISDDPFAVPEVPLFQLTLDENSVGQTFVATPATPNFSEFAAVLTSATGPNFVRIIARIDDASIGSGFSKSIFYDSQGDPVNIQGMAISSVSLHVDAVSLISPGQDPNDNGVWTDTAQAYTMTITPVPEPSACLLSALAVVGLLAFRRHRSAATAA